MNDFTFYTQVNAAGESKDLLDSIQASYGFVPNLFGYMAEAPATIKAYLQLNSLLQETSFNNAQLQVALLTVSVSNKCNFCAGAHRFMAEKFSANPQTVSALLNGSEIEDESDKVLADTVRTIVDDRGWVSEEVLSTFFNAGFTKKHYLELMIVASIKTLSNYINHVTKPELNEELKID